MYGRLVIGSIYTTHQFTSHKVNYVIAVHFVLLTPIRTILRHIGYGTLQICNNEVVILHLRKVGYLIRHIYAGET